MKADVLARIDIFSGLPKRELEHLAAIARVEHVRAGEYLAMEREPGHELYAIQNGRIQLFTRSRIGEITVRVAGPGESLPLAVLLGKGIHVTSARAMTDVDLLSMTRDDLMWVCNDRPVIGAHVYRAAAEVLARRYDETLQRMVASLNRALQGKAPMAPVTETGHRPMERETTPDIPPGGPADWPD